MERPEQDCEREMATYFFDIDGTLVEYHTNRWLPGAKEHLVELCRQGHKIYLMTMRCDARDADSEWSPERTRQTVLRDLNQLGVFCEILWDVASPRVLVDDSPCRAMQRRQNQSWT